MASDTHLHFSRDELLKPDDVADILEVKRTTAMEYMRRGVVPARKIGRHWYSPKPLLDHYLDDLFDIED